MSKVLKIIGIVLPAAVFLLAGCPNPGGSGTVYHTVSFYTGGGSDVASVRVQHGRTLDLPTAPTKDDFLFSTWCTDQGLESKFDVTTPITKNMRLFAKWNPEKSECTVMFDAQGGSLDGPKTVTVPYGGTINPLPETAKDEFDFKGWFANKEGLGSEFTIMTELTDDMVLYARWTAKQGVTIYTVTFNAAGGEFADLTDYQEIAAAEGASISLPLDPTKTGFTFDGWFTQQNGGGTKFTSEIPVTRHITVYANWVSSTVYVTFKNGNETHATLPVTIGQAPGSLPADPEKTNFYFKGWFTGENGAGTQFTAATIVSNTVTVHAYWVDFKVTFDSDGGSAVDPISIAKKGDKISALPTPTKEGYDFKGWFTGKNGAGSKFETTTPVDLPLTVYAHWQVQAGRTEYSVTFNAAGGYFGDNIANTADDIIKVISGGKITTLPEPKKVNHRFDGWFTEGNGAGTSFTNQTVVNDNMTVYAKWILVSVTLTFKNGTEVYDTRTVDLNGTLTADKMPEEPSKTNYYFTGWFDAESGGTQFTTGTTLSDDTTVYAQWIPFVVTFDSKGGSTVNPVTIAKKGDKIPAGQMPNPTKSEYLFDGWFTVDGDNPFNSDTPVNAPLAVYAKWKDDPAYFHYTVTFKPNGGAFADTSTVAKDVSVLNNKTTTPPEVKRNGYRFDGWFEGAAEFTASTAVTKDWTVEAKWVQTVTVTFTGDTNYTPSPASVVIDKGASLGNNLPNPPRDGWAASWNTAQDGSGTSYIGTGPTVTADTILYIQWKETFTKTSTVANTTLYGNLVKTTAANYELGYYGNAGNVLKTANGTNNALEISITPTFTGTLKLTLDAQVMRDKDGYIAWQNKSGWGYVFGSNNTETKTANTWYTFSATQEFTVTSGAKLELQLASTVNETVNWLLKDFSLTATRESSTTTTVFEDFEGTPAPTLTNIGAASSTIKDFNGSKILELTVADGSNRGVAVKITLPGTKKLGDYSNLLVDANLIGGGDGTYKTMYIWVSNTLPTSVSGEGNIKTASQISGSDKTKLLPYLFTLSSLSNWSSAQNYTGDIYLVFGLAYVNTNGCSLGIDNISLEDTSTPYSGFYPLYPGQKANPEGEITLGFTDQGQAAFSQTSFSIAKSTGSQTITLSSGWDNNSAKWYVDGTLKFTGGSITINAADYYKGSHTLTAIATKNGVPWSKALSFTVTD